MGGMGIRSKNRDNNGQIEEMVGFGIINNKKNEGCVLYSDFF